MLLGALHRFGTAAALAVVLVALHTAAGAHGDDTTVEKYQAILTVPEGATNASAKGKVKTQFRVHKQKIYQKLDVAAQQLGNGSSVRVLVDGFELGVFSTRGKSGTLRLQFKSPAKGNLSEIPAEVGLVRDFQLVEIFDATTGELLLTGTFELVPQN
jgi:hypothetical protein